GPPAGHLAVCWKCDRAIEPSSGRRVFLAAELNLCTHASRVWGSSTSVAPRQSSSSCWTSRQVRLPCGRGRATAQVLGGERILCEHRPGWGRRREGLR